MKNILLICLTTITAWSCTEKRHKEIDWKPITDKLSSTIMKFDTIPDIFGGLTLLKDSFLICTQSLPAQTELLLTYEIKTDSLLYRCILAHRGNGPNETAQNPPKAFHIDDKYVITAHGHMPRVFESTNDNSKYLLSRNEWQRHSIKVKDNALLTAITPADGDSDLFYGTMVNHKSHESFYTYKLGDTTIIPIKTLYPEVGFKVDSASYPYMYSGFLHKRPGGDEFVYSIMGGGEYSYIFNIKNSKVQNLSYIYNSPPEMIKGADVSGIFNFQVSPDNSGGYSLAVTAERLYYLDQTQNTRTRWLNYEKQADGNPLWYSNTIYVYDWDGNPITKYSLDKYIESFTVSSDDSVIYANTTDLEKEESQLLRFKL